MMKLTRTAVVLAMAACTAQNPGGDISSIDVAITTTGGDGASYRLTAGARMSLTSTHQSGEPNYDVGLDGDGADVIVHVAPGGYQATLYLDSDPPGFARTEWTLERTVNNVTDTVNGELATGQPVMVTVTGGQTTNLQFQFKTTTGKIVFGRGNLDISIGVGQATNYTAGESGSGSVAQGGFFVGGPDPTDLANLMPKVGDANLHIAVAGHMTGPWTDVGGSVDPGQLNELVCAPFQVDSISGSGQQGLVDLIAEASFGGGVAPNFLFGSSNLCVTDDGTTSSIRIRVTREGTADTAPFQAILGGSAAAFSIQVLGDLGARVFNSATGEFDSDALLGTHTLPLLVRLQILDDSDFSPWYRANVTGASNTFTFSAQ